jgi:hypothetical protein
MRHDKRVQLTKEERVGVAKPGAKTAGLYYSKMTRECAFASDRARLLPAIG